MKNRFAIVATMLLLAACGGKNTESNVEAPGEEKSDKSKALETVPTCYRIKVL